MFSTAEDISLVTLPSTPRDEQEAPQDSQEVKQNKKEITVTMLIKELIFCIALALTTYGAFHNTPSKISKHPLPVRFFSLQSLVSDSFRGHLRHALASINKEDVSFVMYYAPWDAESQYVRGEFEKAAKILNNRVHFAAINCWNPGSECRLQHHKIPSWPILMVYTVTSKSVLYKGARDAYSMVKFLELILKPVERISSTDDLVNLISVCDVVAVGYTPLKDTSKYYNAWYNVAFKAKEFDVIGEICFAVVTSEDLSSDIGVHNLPNARLMLWNDTMEYNVTDDIQQWNESLLLNWIFKNFRQPVARIIPMWQKTTSFERYADGNPMLILFTPLNPLYEMLPSYNMLQEVAMEYYNCNNSDSTALWISELIKLRQIQRLIYQQKDVNKYCKEFKFKKPINKPSPYHKKNVVAQNNKYPWSNASDKLQKTGILESLLKRGISLSSLVGMSRDDAASLDMIEECVSKELPAVKSFYENCQQCDKLEEIMETVEDEYFTYLPETTMLTQEDDSLSSENLTEDDVKHFCNVTKFATTHSTPSKPLDIPHLNIPSIKGLACKMNFTMHMLAVDSVRNHHFAESLGIDIMNKKDRTAVVILDSKHESQYILKEEYSAKSVRDFICNFTDKVLKRSLRSHVFDAAHTHYFGSGGADTKIKEYDVLMKDLTSATFRQLIRKQGMVSIVAICGGICSASVTRAMTEAGRLLNSCGVQVEVARIDALRHDLPWQYTVETYPAIIVFPDNSGRDTESRSYPITERVTSNGVVALALRTMGAPHYLRVRLGLCGITRSNIEKYTCLKEVRDYITTLIGRHLRYWRHTDSKELKDALLKRLQQLHTVSLDLSLVHISDLNNCSLKHKSLLNSLSTLTNKLEVKFNVTKNGS